MATSVSISKSALDSALSSYSACLAETQSEVSKIDSLISSAKDIGKIQLKSCGFMIKQNIMTCIDNIESCQNAINSYVNAIESADIDDVPELYI